MTLLDRCREPAMRHAAIEIELQQPDLMSDGARYLAKMREYRSLAPIAAAYHRYLAAQSALDDAQVLLAEAQELSDDEMEALAKEEAEHARMSMTQLEDEIRILLLPRDEDDDRSVIMEIRAGAGGEEAALFAADLYRMYTMYAEAHGFQVELVNF